jgi:GNAT superfamily N-acetyltransferase
MRIDPPLHTIKVVHTEASAATSPDAEPESETVVGFCMWHIYDQPHPEHQWMKEHEMMTCNWVLDASEREKVWTGILPLFTGRMRMEGRPHALLMSMCVDPAWQRRGTERMLMSWGTERCDELGIPAYLEASPFGYPLYRACGFEDYERLVMRIERGGGGR